MNVTNYVSDITSQVSQVSPFDVPGIIWGYYIEYLWNYSPNSWVSTIAYCCRIISFLFSFPLILLGLLDIASYGIARTLGVIDDVKASTSDGVITQMPTIRLHGSSTPTSSSSTDSDSETRKRSRSSNNNSLGGSTSSLATPHVFYATDSEEDNLKLSGVGVFSPVASEPPSPTISRQNLLFEGKGSGSDQNSTARLRNRAK